MGSKPSATAAVFSAIAKRKDITALLTPEYDLLATNIEQNHSALAVAIRARNLNAMDGTCLCTKVTSHHRPSCSNPRRRSETRT